MGGTKEVIPEEYRRLMADAIEKCSPISRVNLG